jgi:hypothetical protein
MRGIVVGTMLACPFVAGAVEPGNWELSLVTMLTGQPKPAAMTQTRCLTESDARDPSRVLGGAQGGTCNFTNRNDNGRTFTFDVACTGILPMKGKGSVNYTGQTMDADLDLQAEKGEFGMRTFVKGRRLGPC